MTKVTNEVLLEKISNVHEKLDRMDAKQQKFNDTLKVHDDFISRQSIMNKIFVGGGMIIVAALVGTLINTLLG